MTDLYDLLEFAFSVPDIFATIVEQMPIIERYLFIRRCQSINRGDIVVAGNRGKLRAPVKPGCVYLPQVPDQWEEIYDSNTEEYELGYEYYIYQRSYYLLIFAIICDGVYGLVKEQIKRDTNGVIYDEILEQLETALVNNRIHDVKLFSNTKIYNVVYDDFKRNTVHSEYISLYLANYLYKIHKTNELKLISKSGAMVREESNQRFYGQSLLLIIYQTMIGNVIEYNFSESLYIDLLKDIITYYRRYSSSINSELTWYLYKTICTDNIATLKAVRATLCKEYTK